MKTRWVLFILAACALALGGCRAKRTAAPAAAVRPMPVPVTGTTADSNDAAMVERLIEGARGWIGTPYRYGGTDRSGADCSGFLQRLFADVAAVSLPRNSAKQAEYCRPVARERLQPGDLVFFNGSRIGGSIGHVGLYVGGGRMIHASSSRGIIESSMTDAYYTPRYCCGGRVEAITYAARGSAPKSELIAPAPPPLPDRAHILEISIDALVDSAFAASARASAPDSVISSWMD